jgi:hypothetical protein
LHFVAILDKHGKEVGVEVQNDCDKLGVATFIDSEVKPFEDEIKDLEDFVLLRINTGI